ncbi:MAG: FAD-dependent oxidoreductase, partial [Bdellovibrionaceae bacterium]|nr:FAD-dependent oxidoreductase [Pseudobdellovibrionaceae bacterium]
MKKIDRREFLKWGFGAVSATGLAGCGLMNRVFSIEKNNLDREVLIVGGGLAGLTAAYELKKAGVPFRLFEASSRLGGRVMTLKEFGGEGGFIDMGGEIIEAHHQAIRKLCDEFYLKLEDVSANESPSRDVFVVDGRLEGPTEFFHRIRPVIDSSIRLAQRFFGDEIPDVERLKILQNDAHARQLDQMSVFELFSSQNMRLDRRYVLTYANAFRADTGGDPENFSALAWVLRTHYLQQKRLNFGRNQYQLQFGSSLLVRTLYDRICGVLPDYLVRLNSPLKSIRQRGNRIECIFQTPQGAMEVSAQRVILAMPLIKLRDVKGLLSLEGDPDIKRAIQ